MYNENILNLLWSIWLVGLNQFKKIKNILILRFETTKLVNNLHIGANSNQCFSKHSIIDESYLLNGLCYGLQTINSTNCNSFALLVAILGG